MNNYMSLLSSHHSVDCSLLLMYIQCDGALIQRSDDVEETIRERLKVYHDNANPLLEYYVRRGIVLQWPVIRGLEDTKELLSMIDNSLEQNKDNHF